MLLSFLFLVAFRSSLEGRVPHMQIRFMFLLRYVLFTLAVAVFAAGYADAQGGVDYTGTGGGQTIKGRIFYPSGRRTDTTGLRVVLQGSNTGDLIVFADSNGSFAFRNLVGGTYTVVIDAGSEYELVRESVYVDETASRNVRGGMPRTYNVPIYLTTKRGRQTESRPAVINASLASVPASAREAYDRALDFERNNDTGHAVESLKTAISLYANFPLALNELGVQYLKLGQAGQAAEVLWKAVQLVPEDIPPRLNYAIALLNLRQFDQAERAFRDLLKRNESLPTAHMYLGITLVSERKLDEAEQELLKAIASPSREVAQAHRYLGGIYWGEREYKKAADELEAYLKLAPNAFDAERAQAAIKELRSKQ